MPTRREEEEGQRRRDPYNRAWFKVPTETIDREGFSDLSHTDMGVLFRMMMFSVARSYDIGYFADKATNIPMSRAHIVKAVRPTEGEPAKHDADAHAALDTFLRVGLAHEEDTNGYYFDSDFFESWLHINNLTERRDADARRQSRHRAKQREQQRQAEKASKGSSPPPPDPTPPSTNGHGPKLALVPGRRRERRA